MQKTAEWSEKAVSDLLIACDVVLIVIAAGSAAKCVHELAVRGGHGEPGGLLMWWGSRLAWHQSAMTGVIIEFIVPPNLLSN